MSLNGSKSLEQLCNAYLSHIKAGISSYRGMLQRFGPKEDHIRLTKHPIYRDSIGFFIAKFVKKEILNEN